MRGDCSALSASGAVAVAASTQLVLHCDSPMRIDSQSPPPPPPPRLLSDCALRTCPGWPAEVVPSATPPGSHAPNYALALHPRLVNRHSPGAGPHIESPLSPTLTAHTAAERLASASPESSPLSAASDKRASTVLPRTVTPAVRNALRSSDRGSSARCSTHVGHLLGLSLPIRLDSRDSQYRSSGPTASCSLDSACPATPLSRQPRKAEGPCGGLNCLAHTPLLDPFLVIRGPASSSSWHRRKAKPIKKADLDVSLLPSSPSEQTTILQSLESISLAQDNHLASSHTLTT
ncbi:uncharacterized protein PSANT_04807 [Moesziomyces antarcticus]|uniref:Uncharacterized protein n=1 Tax=Pseudozyma antarctica TaxID=84753 RepID=A0A5C3FSG4_PSEA2|nr:uncharacterized protein PSANT_04807 [Moesziomyces antarcticus]